MKRYDLENYEDSLSIMDVATDGEWVDYHDAAEAIQQAHRSGWEQAKREALCAATLYLCNPVGEKISDAIAAMEYKEGDHEM